MSGTLEPERRSHSVAATLAVPVLVVAAVALIGWLLLLFVKGLVVVLCYAVGAALVVVPPFMGRRIIGDARGGERWRRIGNLVTAMLLGVALIVTGYFVARHGWLIVAVPVGLIAISRIVDAVGARLPGRRQDAGR